MYKIYYCCLFLILSTTIYSQSERKRANFWHFGNQAQLDFTCAPPTSLPGSAMNSSEGSASISDLNGDLLLYTNGVSVWDKNNNVMPNGTGLLGHQSTVQSAIIVPHPGNPNNYFIFTAGTSLEDAGLIGVHFSEVDMTLNGGNGDVLPGNKNTFLFSPNEEKLTGVINATGDGYWVTAQVKSLNIWHTYEINAAGVNMTPVTSITGPNARPDNSLGAKFSPDGTMLVSQNGCPGNANLTLYSFDNATGIIEYAWSDCGTPGFNLEFSPDCSKLYAAGSQMYQYDLAAGATFADSVPVKASKTQITTTNWAVDALQVANDCKIYVAEGGTSIGIINNPNAAGLACNYSSGSYNLTSGTTAQRFPNFIQSFFVGPCENLEFELTANDASCFPDGSIDLTILSGLPPYNYLWSNGETTEDISNLSGGMYSVTVTDFNNCPKTDSIFVVQPPTALIDNAIITNPTSCAGTDGSIDLTISLVGGSSENILTEDFETDGNGPRYSISGGEDNGSRFFKRGQDANFTFVSGPVTNENGSFFFGARRVTAQPASLTLNPVSITGYSNLEVCFLLGSFGSANAADHYRLEYNVDGAGWTRITSFRENGGFPARISEDTNNDGTGDGIQLTAALQDFCYSLPISGNSLELRVVIVSAASTQSQFAFDYIRLNGIAPQSYSVLWNTSATTDDINTLSSGAYDIEITTTSGCVVTANYNLTDPCDLLASITPSATSVCQGESIIFNDNSFGTNIVSWDWTFTGGNPSTQTGIGPHSVSFSTPGPHNVTLVIENNLGDTDDTTIVITVNSLPTIVANNDGPACTGSDVELTATGGASYSWTGPNGFTGSSNTELLTNTTAADAGIYTVIGSDANGCENSAQTTVVLSSGLTLAISSTPVLCNGDATGTATVVPSGGTPSYTYAWSPSGATTDVATNLSQGTHSVVVTDFTGCTAQTSILVDEPTALSLSTSSTPSQCTANTGTATVNVSGGFPGYTYSWSPSGGSGATTTAIGAGNYQVTVTDLNNCDAQANIIVTSINGPTISIVDSENISCFGMNDGSAEVTSSGGTPGYTYSWSPSGGSANTASNLSPDTYTVTTTDAAGCTDNIEITITEPTALTLTESITNANCGTQDGEITINANGGTAGYTYVWTPNVSTTNIASNLSSGDYDVTVTDGSGCVINGSYNVALQGSFPLDAISNLSIITAGESVQLDININASITIDSILWSPTIGLSCTTCSNPIATPLVTTTYTVIVYSSDGCESTSSITIVVTEPCAEVFIPSIFSPNGDGNNDMECVFGSCISSLEFTIYNRWGEKIFHSDDQQKCWDGTFRGELVQSGVYAYKAIIKLDNGETLSESGNITVTK